MEATKLYGRQPMVGNENRVERTFAGGVRRTFVRTDGYWQCEEQPLPNPVRHLKDAIRTIKDKA